jgi:uncharacterized protein
MTKQDLKLPIPLSEIQSIMTKHGVVHASIFGSYSRGEQTEKSDLDFLVEFKEAQSGYATVDLKAALEVATHKEVDVTTKIHPRFEEYIIPDLVGVL